ncbi:Rv3654c family TadE-like protein [Corynebacterium sp.]|uniref:Rv3654c family TadE-like protein n=1 Tax=Corynebacterium sp. TaxID=1720 RepID=UPI003B3A795A
MNRRLCGDDAGSATVAGAAVILAVVALALLIGTGVTGLVQGQRASSAADVTALSAATVLDRAGPEAACEAAASVAAANGARLTLCALVWGEQTDHGPAGAEGMDVTVSIGGRTASAAAGPVR